VNESVPAGRDASPWELYERSVREALAALDPRAEVLHNQRVKGRLSGAMRQIDVLARGLVAGVEIALVVECKMYQRPVAIGDVDQFVGKLIDIGADRGILYSGSGFTGGAAPRAMGAANPAVMPVVLKISEAAPVVGSEVAQGEDSGPVEAFAWLANDFNRRTFANFLLTGKQSP
jgi:hypothetical protein